MRILKLTDPRAAYVVGLALIVVMITFQFVGTRFLAAQQEVAALEINLTGRQRMLSQRIALEVEQLNHLNGSASVEDVARQRSIILACVDLMEMSHVALRSRNADTLREVLDMGAGCLLPSLDAPSINKSEPLIIEDAPILAQFVSMARAVGLGEVAVDDIDLEFVSRETLVALLAQLNSLTDQAQENAIEQVNLFLIISWVLLVLLIISEVVIIFRPMARSVEENIQKLRAANAQLGRNEKRLHDFATTGVHHFWETDADHRFTWISAAKANSKPFDKHHLLGKRRWDAPGVLDDADSADWQAHRAALDSRSRFANFEYQVTHIDGSVTWWRVHGRPCFDGYGVFTGYRGTSLDVTEEKQAEIQSRQSERMSALGQLTAGVAHDFNNLLSVIRGNAELIDLEADPKERHKNISEIVSSVERGASLTARLLAFGRVQILKAEPIEVGAFLQNMSDLLGRTLGENFAIHTIPPLQKIFVHVDRHQLEDAFVNIALNARDACTAGGRLLIEASSHSRVVHMPVSGQDFGSGDYVCLSFQDTGCGMSPSELSRIFEPFYTTKKVGEGSGLGLSMVYGFALQSEGFVDATSVPGEGTTVSLYLPRATNTSVPVNDTNLPRRAQTKGKRVLLLEDNYALRRIARRMLEQLGLEVQEAEDGEMALTILQQQGTFDLLIADILLPGALNGIDVAHQARSLQPGIAVLFSSGFVGEDTAQEQFGQLTAPLLNKPYSRQQLKDQLTALLGADFLITSP